MERETEIKVETEDGEMYQRFMRHDHRSFLVILFVKDGGIKKVMIGCRVYRGIGDGS